MTRTQRRHHLIAWLVLSPAILAVLIGAIALRAQGLHTAPAPGEARP